MTAGVTGDRDVPAGLVEALTRAPGRALMLGHVHPDADVLGTLLALGLALEGRGWEIRYGGPHPAPAALDFLPAIERYERLPSVGEAFDIVALTDCPNPDRTEGLLAQAPASAPTSEQRNGIHSSLPVEARSKPRAS